jgi:hypothetical protein
MHMPCGRAGQAQQPARRLIRSFLLAHVTSRRLFTRGVCVAAADTTPHGTSASRDAGLSYFLSILYFEIYPMQIPVYVLPCSARPPAQGRAHALLFM